MTFCFKKYDGVEYQVLPLGQTSSAKTGLSVLPLCCGFVSKAPICSSFVSFPLAVSTLLSSSVNSTVFMFGRGGKRGGRPALPSINRHSPRSAARPVAGPSPGAPSKPTTDLSVRGRGVKGRSPRSGAAPSLPPITASGGHTRGTPALKSPKGSLLRNIMCVCLESHVVGSASFAKY